MKQARDFYYESYIKFLTKEMSTISLEDLDMFPFIDLNMFIEDYIRTLEIKSYLAIIIDKKSELDLRLIKVINSIIRGRIKGMYMKIFIEQTSDWQTFYTDISGCGNAGVIQHIHDYDILKYNPKTKKLTFDN